MHTEICSSRLIRYIRVESIFHLIKMGFLASTLPLSKVSDNAAVEVTKCADWSTSCPDINGLQKRVVTKQCMYRNRGEIVEPKVL
jgi:hypothetical protein